MNYYHVWFQTKCRKKILIDFIDKRAHELFDQIAANKGIRLIAFETMPEHVHMLIELSPSDNLSYAVKMFKGISSRMIFKEYPLLKFQFRVNNLWAKSFAYKEIPKEKLSVVINYIRHQKDDFEVLNSPHFNVGCTVKGL